MAVRRRSKGLQQAIDNFTKGLQMGWTHRDKQDDRQAKLDAAAFARQKWAQEAEIKRQELGIAGRKADAYVGLAGAQAGYYGRKGAGGGGGASADGLSPQGRAFVDQTGGQTFQLSSPPAATIVRTESSDPPPLPEPGSLATGGKVPQRFAGGGRAARAVGGMKGAMGGYDAGARIGRGIWGDRSKPAGTPPINPNAPAPDVSPITRTATVQTYYDGGKSGPGSGFGEIAPAPPGAIRTVPAYQQGGRVQKFQAGGSASPGLTSLLGTMANALGVPRPGQTGTPQEGRIVYDEQGGAVWMTPTGGGQPYNPQYGGNTYGGATPGGAKPGGATYGGNTYGGQKFGGNTYGGATPGGWRHRTPTHDTVTNDPGETGGFPEPTPAVEPEFNFVMPGEAGETGGTPAPQNAPVVRGNGRGGGGGYQARGGGLGDQRRERAYDPVADRMDPRNIGVVNEGGGVNPMVYAATQHGGIELNAPGQQIYRQGGRVQRFQRGGDVTQGARLPVPATGREYGTPPQGAGEAPDAGQAEADALTLQWREEALAAAEANQQAAQAPPGGNRYGGQTYGGQTFGGNRYGGNRFGASAGPGETGGQPDVTPPRPPQQIHGAPSQPPSPNLTGPSQDDPPRNVQVHGAPSQPPSPRLNAPRTDVPGRLSPTGLPPAPDYGPPVANEETGPDAPLPSQAYVPQIPDPTRPTAHDEAAGTGQRITGPPTNGGPRPPTQPSSPSSGRATPARPGVTAPSAGQDEADRLTREWNAKNQAGPQAGQGVSPITKKGAVDTTAPMQQGTYEPEGGTGLQGPGKGISTNNAARDHLGAATTFADWAMKDAGPEKKEQATAALYSGKGAGTTEQIAAMMMAVDPENKMPLDKRFEAATKLAHDIHIANGDVKAAGESSFEMMQYGVTKAREHGGQAVKMIQAGNEQGALKELMAGYTWIADKATVATKDGSIVVTGDDGKVRAQIPLQEGTVQNLAMGMMSGQLPWDAIRRGASATGTPAQPTQAVATQPPAASAAQPSAAPAAPPPSPAAAVDTTPPTARPQPAPAPPSAAPAPAPRPSPKPTQVPETGGAQTKPPPSTKAFPVVDLDKEAKETQARIDARASDPSKVEPAKTEQKTEQKTAEKTEAAGAKDDEAKLKEWHDKNPYEPPPGKIETKTSTAGLDEVNAALQQNQASYDKAVHDLHVKADQLKLPDKERRELLPKRIAEYKAKFEHQRGVLEKQRDRVIDRGMAAEQRERDEKTRKVDQSAEKEFKDTFTTRAAEIMKVEGRTPEQKEKAKAALERSVLRYQIDPSERKELERLSREVWKTNEQMDTRDAFDAVVGMTEIHPKDTGKVMNRQKGEKATSFQPVARTPKGDYVVVLPSGERATISENVYQRITSMHQQNWAQWQREQAMSDAEKAKQAKARETLAKEAITTRAPTAQGNK